MNLLYVVTGDSKGCKASLLSARKHSLLRMHLGTHPASSFAKGEKATRRTLISNIPLIKYRVLEMFTMPLTSGQLSTMQKEVFFLIFQILLRALPPTSGNAYRTFLWCQAGWPCSAFEDVHGRSPASLS